MNSFAARRQANSSFLIHRENSHSLCNFGEWGNRPCEVRFVLVQPEMESRRFPPSYTAWLAIGVVKGMEQKALCSSPCLAGRACPQVVDCFRQVILVRPLCR